MSGLAQATLASRAGSKRAAMRTGILLGCARRASRSAWSIVTASLALGLGAGCTASADAVRPVQNVLYYPTGVAVAPGDAVMFVVNANSDLRYDSGYVSVFDLAGIDAAASAWTTSQTIPDGCTRDKSHPETIDCKQSQFMVPNAAARIGNFATDIGVQDTGNGTTRLIIPTRGDPSVTWLDWNGTALSCSTSKESFALCDDAHRLTYVHDDPSLASLPPEPFGVFADKSGQFAMVTHLTTGDVTLIDSPIGGKATIADVATGVFQSNPATGLIGADGIAGRTPGSPGDIIYVGSTSENRIQTFTVGRPVNKAPPYLIPGDWFFLDGYGADAGGSSDTRSMAFSASGDRLYIVNRNPPSLQIYDTSLGTDGFPRNKLLGATDLCLDASTVSVMDAGDGDRAYVSCFNDSQIYVIDPSGLSMLADVIPVGRGPYSVATSAARKKVYVSNFLDNTVGVIDASPTSASRDRVVLLLVQDLPK